MRTRGTYKDVHPGWEELTEYLRFWWIWKNPTGKKIMELLRVSEDTWDVYIREANSIRYIRVGDQERAD